MELIDKEMYEKYPCLYRAEDGACAACVYMCDCGWPEDCKVRKETVERQPTLTPPNEPLTLEFDVVDTTTGKYPDWGRIAREEAWAKGLVYCDMDGIAIREDGSLILLDECGNCVSCPLDRFEIRRRPPEGEEGDADRG